MAADHEEAHSDPRPHELEPHSETRDRTTAGGSAIRARPTISFDELEEVAPRQQTGRLLVIRPEDFERFFQQLMTAIDAVVAQATSAVHDLERHGETQAQEQWDAMRKELQEVLEKLKTTGDSRSDELERFRFDWIQSELKELRKLVDETPRKQHHQWWKLW